MWSVCAVSDRDPRRFRGRDLADHDHVRILAQKEVLKCRGERHAALVVPLDLVHACWQTISTGSSTVEMRPSVFRDVQRRIQRHGLPEPVIPSPAPFRKASGWRRGTTASGRLRSRASMPILAAEPSSDAQHDLRPNRVAGATKSTALD